MNSITRAPLSIVTRLQLYEVALVANTTYRVAREKMFPLNFEYPVPTLECVVLEQ